MVKTETKIDITVTAEMVQRVLPQFADDEWRCATIAQMPNAPHGRAFLGAALSYAFQYHRGYQMGHLPDWLVAASRHTNSRGGDLALWTAVVRWVTELECEHPFEAAW